jgi:hypothetical protein
MPRHLSWVEQSRTHWANIANPTSDERIAIGCFQRIATALERLADLFDPEEQKRQAEREESRKRDIEREGLIIDWEGVHFRPAQAIVRDKIRQILDLIQKKRPGGLSSWGVARTLLFHFCGYTSDWYRKPAEEQPFLKFAEQLDIASVAWKEFLSAPKALRDLQQASLIAQERAAQAHSASAEAQQSSLQNHQHAPGESAG